MADFDKNLAGYNLLKSQFKKEGRDTSLFDALLSKYKTEQGQTQTRDEAFNPFAYQQEMAGNEPENYLFTKPSLTTTSPSLGQLRGEQKNRQEALRGVPKISQIKGNF
jgi:hypothetical protein